jgi:hypothetical protein
MFDLSGRILHGLKSKHVRIFLKIHRYLEQRLFVGLDLIGIMKFHFFVYVQNGFSAAQLTCIQDALDLLKRFEFIQTQEGERSGTIASSQGQNQIKQ